MCHLDALALIRANRAKPTQCLAHNVASLILRWTKVSSWNIGKISFLPSEVVAEENLSSFLVHRSNKRRLYIHIFVISPSHSRQPLILFGYWNALLWYSSIFSLHVLWFRSIQLTLDISSIHPASSFCNFITSAKSSMTRTACLGTNMGMSTWICEPGSVCVNYSLDPKKYPTLYYFLSVYIFISNLALFCTNDELPDSHNWP